MLKHQEEVPKGCALKKAVSLFGRLTGPERGEPLALGNITAPLYRCLDESLGRQGSGPSWQLPLLWFP